MRFWSSTGQVFSGRAGPPAAWDGDHGLGGQDTNRQIGVFACDATRRGHAFIDRELHLPKSWTDDKARMAKAHVPQEMIESAHGGFATKPA